MSDIHFKAWGIQKDILKDNSRTIAAFAAKRSGKTEVASIKSIMFQEQKVNYNKKSIDPFVGAIIAPTNQMLTRLSLKKFMLYAKPFIKDFNISKNEITWHDDSIVYGLSAERPERIEGLKLNWCWLDEVLQMSEQTYLEVVARTADTQGNILLTGSLGVQYVNPKAHWCHRIFKENKNKDVSIYEWTTISNPHFPKSELENLRNNLDPQTFRAMFELDWSTTPLNSVYSDFDEGNITRGYVYNPNFKTYVSIDWGFAHPAACLWFQWDEQRNIVYLFDEIVMSGLTLDKMWGMISSKPYKIDGYCCDIAGNQEREQTAISNIRWFKEKYNVNFKYGRYTILPGIAFVRTYIKNGLGQSKFVVDERCIKTIDSIKLYKFPTKSGMISNENPEKLADDPVDAIRYFFENYIKAKRPLLIEIG